MIKPKSQNSKININKSDRSDSCSKLFEKKTANSYLCLHIIKIYIKCA